MILAPWLPAIRPGTPGCARLFITLPLLRDTPRAWLARLPDGREVWLPRSVCGAIEDPAAGPGMMRFNLPLWLARRLAEPA